MLDRSQQPEIRDFRNLRLDFPQHIILPNGVKMYIVDSGDQDVSRIELIYRGGQFEQKMPLQAGAMVSMLVHGGGKYNSNDISEILDYYGSWYGCSHNDHYTQLLMHLPNEHIEKVLPVFRAITMEPSFPEREFALLKSQMKSAYRTAWERVKYIASVKSNTLLFGNGHPLAHEICEDDVESLSVDDLKLFYQQFYRPENCTIVISGKRSERIIESVARVYGDIPVSGKQAEFKSYALNRSKSRFEIFNKPGALQSAVEMNLPAIKRDHTDYIKLRILVTVLGGYFGSRLMSNIREDKGYTYGINAALIGRKDCSYINISSECDTAYTKPLISEVENEINRLMEIPIDEAELATVKNYMLSDLAKTLDSPFSIASVVSSSMFYGTPEDYFNRQVEELEKITSEELEKIAKRYLNIEKNCTVVAGDNNFLKFE